MWAKHDRSSGGWLPLWRHMADSGAVAGRLWDRWLPEQVRRLAAEALPAGEADGRRLAVWLATTHDIGKATPAFACQVEELAHEMRCQGLAMPSHRQLGKDRRLAPHGLAGQQLLAEWLRRSHGWSGSAPMQFAVVVGGHHGVPPARGDARALADYPELLRTPGSAEARWRAVQEELLEACARVAGVDARLAAWRDVRLPQPVQAVLSGLVIVADWIASNPDLFPYFPDARGQFSETRWEAAWRGLALPEPWRAVAPVGSAEELFADRFSLPAGARVRPVQEAAVALARGMARPGLLVVEAPMGEGKTEAALAAVEIFAARSGAGGCFFALPTMATGNAMFRRLLDWLERLPDEDAERGAHAVFLAHSKSALNPRYTELMRGTGKPVAVDIDGPADSWEYRADARTDSAELVAHHWLRGRKKGMLSSFVAGTVDQLLFSALKSRHLALRHLALAGKVVVVDEAHAYDTYMSAYLDRALSWLGAYGVPVVVLSATLPAGRRAELARAYAGEDVPEAAFAEVRTAADYPLMTAVCPGGAPMLRRPEASGRATEVWLEPLGDDPAALADRLVAELAEGGCALVVRNTVDRVMDTAAQLRERFGPDAVTVAHSRFVDLHRAEKDAGLLARFGPPGECDGHRPEGPHVVVASQVVEQSLDVDFDLLVTDLAPVDLVLQRLGRLHRHQRGEQQHDRPPRLRTARCLVTGVDWAAETPEPVSGSRVIYGAYPLLRSLAVLLPHLEPDGPPVRLPDDISPLVQTAYGEGRPEPDSWRHLVEAAAQEHERLRAAQHRKADDFRLAEAGRPGRALLGWVDAGVGDADDTRAGRQQVRDTPETLEVLVVQRTADGELRTLPGLPDDEEGRRGGLSLPLDAVPPPRLARIVASCGLRLPYQFSFRKVADQAIEELEQLCVPAWQQRECHWLAGQLILALDEECQCRLAGFELRYTRADGLEVTRAP
ncbi:CRISPR-associated helicase Cas3' [Streptomyces sp. OF3]|uniref:CRISPR-associated helicase Cas3 n=4 Tax=Streptomyces alkaliterrae TaxID=2213162 RepID=A0A7W3WYL5_9ACTN|nr:CRISPR-associated helicase Cas3' [Streptomyces alkaliterrae]MBB1260899.1 CRISPR-associated helicase Cas3' [Streptomyces alkaliterrae]